MRKEIMNQLSIITKEEQEILQGQRLNQKRYTNRDEFVIDSHKMLAMGQMIEIRPHTRFVDFPRHKHNYIEIIYMIKGMTIHHLEDFITVCLREGELLFLNQHCYHSIEAAGREDLAVNFMILPEFFDTAFTMIEEENELKNFLTDILTQDEKKASYLHFKVGDELPVQNLLENMIWSVKNKRQSDNRKNQITMGLLLLHLMECTDKLQYHDKKQLESQIAMKTLQYIEENYREGTLGFFAQREHMSIYQLSRLIKRQTGYTFKELLRIKRLNKAAQLLTETDLSVADIIAAVGYDNTSYFFKVFHEKYDLSPREYRVKKSAAAK